MSVRVPVPEVMSAFSRSYHTLRQYDSTLSGFPCSTFGSLRTLDIKPFIAIYLSAVTMNSSFRDAHGSLLSLGVCGTLCPGIAKQRGACYTTCWTIRAKVDGVSIWRPQEPVSLHCMFSDSFPSMSLFSVGLTKQWHFINFFIFWYRCLPVGMVTAVANSITNCQPWKLMHRRNNMWTEQVEFIYLGPHFVCCDKKVDGTKTRDLPLLLGAGCG